MKLATVSLNLLVPPPSPSRGSERAVSTSSQSLSINSSLFLPPSGRRDTERERGRGGTRVRVYPQGFKSEAKAASLPQSETVVTATGGVCSTAASPERRNAKQNRKLAVAAATRASEEFHAGAEKPRLLGAPKERGTGGHSFIHHLHPHSSSAEGQL